MYKGIQVLLCIPYIAKYISQTSLSAPTRTLRENTWQYLNYMTILFCDSIRVEKSAI